MTLKRTRLWLGNTGIRPGDRLYFPEDYGKLLKFTTCFVVGMRIGRIQQNLPTTGIFFNF
jgi:hypothetical protein